MSALPNASYSAPGVNIWAYANQLGPPNLSESTLTLIADPVSTIIDSYPGGFQIETLENSNPIGSIRIADFAKGVIITDSNGTETIFGGDTVQVSSLSSISVKGNYGEFSTISSMNGNIYDLYTSSIFANTLVIDAQRLTADSQDLLLNGVPIATISDLPNLEEWSYKPAISTIDAANNDLISVNKAYCSSLTSINISTVNLVADNILAKNAMIENLMVISSFLSSISTTVIGASSINTSSLECYALRSQEATFDTISVNNIYTQEEPFTITSLKEMSINAFSTLFINSASSINISTNKFNLSSFTDTNIVSKESTIMLSGQTTSLGSRLIELRSLSSIITAQDISITASRAIGNDPVTVSVTAGNQNSEGIIILAAGDTDTKTQRGIAVLSSGGGENIGGEVRLISLASGDANLGGIIRITTEAPDAPVENNSLVIIECGLLAVNGAEIVPPGQLGDPVYAPGVLKVENITNVSSINASTIIGSNASISSLYVSSINGANLSNFSASGWSSYPALSDVNMNGYSLTSPSKDMSINCGSNFSINSGSNINFTTSKVMNVNVGNHTENAGYYSNTVDKGVNVFTEAVIALNAKNGNRGQVFLIADQGYANGIGGEVYITANGGSLLGTVGQGGKINIVANTGTGLSNVPSVVNVGAGGVNIYSGPVPSFVAYPGYTFIYGASGNSICAGLPPVSPTFPGTTFLYGTAGVTVGSALYANNVYPYTDGSSSNDLIIRGRTSPVAKTQLLDCRQVSFVAGQGQITELSTINGLPYSPGGNLSTFSTFAVSTLTATNLINSTIYTSTIGTPYYNAIILNADGGMDLNGGGGDINISGAGQLLVQTDIANSGYLLTTSSILMSSLNGYNISQLLNPADQPNLNLSTLNVSSFVNTSTLNASSINSGIAVISTIATNTVDGEDGVYINLSDSGGIRVGAAGYDFTFREGVNSVNLSTNMYFASGLELKASSIVMSSLNGYNISQILNPADQPNLSLSTLNVSSFVNANSLNASTISTGIIAGGNSLVGGAPFGVVFDSPTNGVFFSTPSVVIPGFINGNTSAFNNVRTAALSTNTISSLAITASTLTTSGGLIGNFISSIGAIRAGTSLLGNNLAVTAYTRSAAVSTTTISTATMIVSSINGFAYPLSTFSTFSVSSLTDIGDTTTGTLRAASISTNSISTANIAVSTINSRKVPLIQYGVSTFQATAFNIVVPITYVSTAFAISICPTAQTTQPCHASTVNISTIQVHAGAASAGIAFSWMTTGIYY